MQEKQSYDSYRESSAKRGYNSKWRKARLAYLQAHPLCVKCLEKGTPVSATIVDHIIPHRGRYDLFWDSSNWQPLCKSCHDAKTAREDGGFGNNISQH
jgi:5-methylcytosine-specific restriction protein A